jgi:hypothetical protein
MSRSTSGLEDFKDADYNADNVTILTTSVMLTATSRLTMWQLWRWSSGDCSIFVFCIAANLFGTYSKANTSNMKQVYSGRWSTQVGISAWNVNEHRAMF